MQFVSRRRELDGGGPSLASNKRAKISIYEQPPDGEVSLEEFEQFALDRMRVLKAIDSSKAKGVKPEELSKIIETSLNQYLPLRDKGEDVEEDRRKDHVSHFILRIAYSRTEDLRRWFLRQEEQLFRHRFNNLDVDSRNHIMTMLNSKGGANAETELKTMDQDEWDMYSGELLQLFGNVAVAGSEILKNVHRQPWQHIYKVPFEEVPDLIAQRKVLLKRGSAFVISRDIVSVVMNNFRLRLSKQLTENARFFYSKAEEESERLGPLLHNLTNAYLGADFSSGPVTGRITLDKLPAAINRSAPMCMRALFQKMSGSPHHLKHDGRMQFGLFLKGIGVTLEDSLAWWREEMMRGGKTAEQFDKAYAYNIRHNYGQEGKRTNYTPYSCMKIISSTPVGEQCHGCPYKHWEESRLVSAMNQMRLPSNVIHDVVDKVKGSHFQVACQKVFEATHPGGTTESLNHPNQYFQDSIKYYEDKSGESKGKEEGSSAFAPPSAPAAPAAPQPAASAFAPPAAPGAAAAAPAGGSDKMEEA